MDSKILPLAITMVAGPQIMSAILFVTSPKVVKLSLAYISGAAIGVIGGVCAARGITALLGNSVDLGSGNSSTGQIIQYVLVGLLVLLMIKNYRGREEIETPKWMSGLMEMEPRKAFLLGMALLSIFPSDAMVLLTVGIHLEQHGKGITAAIPFMALTILFISLPFLGYTLFRGRAERAMPKMRDWMTSHAWLVNIAVLGIFVLLILG